MAISKIKPIKSTLKKALDYIMNPEKTEGGQLISSFGCSELTADIEMQLTSGKARNESERLGYHLIQSFSPEDDITPEKALELGKEFADKLLDGKYEYVIATHTDRDHIHNHIIFNSTSFVDYKKYHMPYWHKYRMFNINDKICRDNNLSVIEHKSGEKGKNWHELNREGRGTNWKHKIKEAIDKAVKEAKDYEEFLHIMEMEGYEYEESNVLLKFRAGAEGQIKFTRTRTIGEDYTKEMLIKRIEDKQFNMERVQVTNSRKHKSVSVENKIRTKRSMNLIIDISKNTKAQQSKGYEHALVMANINTMARTMNYLQQNGLTTSEKLSAYMAERHSVVEALERNFLNLESERKALSEKIKFSQNYVKYKKVAMQARRKNVGDEFLKIHRDEIMLFNVAEIYMNKNGIDTSYLDIRQMIAEHKQLLEKRKIFNFEIKDAREKMKEIENVRNNVEQILGERIEVEYEKKAKSTLEENAKYTDMEKEDF